jgi:hypothetical protein
MRALGASRTSVVPGGALAGGWTRNALWKTARAVPSLDLRFADNKTLGDAVGGSSLVTFTRASSATFTGSDGLLKTATTNEPRFDHNPTTGESLGLLVEEARTNLLLNSGTLSTQSATVTAVAHTLHFTGTGTITLTGASTAGPLVGTGTGEANRVSLTFTPTAGSLTLTVSGTVANAQLEAGAFRTSYIPTPTATVTRAADVASITGSNFSSWYNQTEGTVFADSIQANITPVSRIVSASDNTTSNRISLTRASASSGNINLTVTNAGTAQVAGVLLGSSLVAGTSNKVAAGYKAADFAGSVNGLASVTQGTGTVPGSLTQLTIGNGDVLSNNPMNGTIKRLVYWGQRLPNNVLQAITQ